MEKESLSWELMLGDGLDLMQSLPDSSVDALITDPPYGTTALGFDKIKIDWQAWWTEAKRVTKRTAPIVMFGQQPFTTDLIMSNRAMFRYQVIWQKTMPVGFLDAKARPMRCHEDILIFAHVGACGSNKVRPTYNPQKTLAHPAETKKRAGAGGMRHYRPIQRKEVTIYDGSRYPRDVITFSNGKGTGSQRRAKNHHPTVKPIDLMRYLVATYSNEGELVVDPFAGSGSTGVACMQLGRHFLGAEIDPIYHELATKRITEEGLEVQSEVVAAGDAIPLFVDNDR